MGILFRLIEEEILTWLSENRPDEEPPLFSAIDTRPIAEDEEFMIQLQERVETDIILTIQSRELQALVRNLFTQRFREEIARTINTVMSAGCAEAQMNGVTRKPSVNATTRLRRMGFGDMWMTPSSANLEVPPVIDRDFLSAVLKN